jgi:hypothetical protein
VKKKKKILSIKNRLFKITIKKWIILSKKLIEYFRNLKRKREKIDIRILIIKSKKRKLIVNLIDIGKSKKEKIKKKKLGSEFFIIF